MMTAAEWFECCLRPAERVNCEISEAGIWLRLRHESNFSGSVADVRAMLIAAGFEPGSKHNDYPYFRISVLPANQSSPPPPIAPQPEPPPLTPSESPPPADLNPITKRSTTWLI